MIKKHLPLLLLFLFAFLIRLAFVPNPGFEADVSFWKGWGLAAADKGVVWSMLNTNNNYPTPFAYTLGAMVVVYRFLGGNPHNVDVFWSNTNTRFLFASKLYPILTDLAIAGILIWITRRPTLFGFPLIQKLPKPKGLAGMLHLSPENFGLLLAGLYLLNPISIIDGAWWGQIDSVGVFWFLVCFLALARKKLFIAGCIFMFAMSTKLQNMIYAPLLFAFIWQQYGLTAMVKTLSGAIFAFFALNIEFFLSNNKSRVIGSLVDNYDYFPYMSLHAYNIWWIISGGNGMGMSDKLLMIGRSSAKQLGLIFFSASYLLTILSVIMPSVISTLLGKYTKVKDNDQLLLHPNAVEKFWLGMCIINAAFFLLLTQSHERYAFPLSVFLLLLLPFVQGTRRLILFISYIFFSILYFYNLHTAFSVNYPQNTFTFLQGWFLTPVPTMAVSAIFMLGYLAFLIYYRKTLTAVPLIISGLFVMALFIQQNMSFWQNKPQALSTFTPWYSAQQFGRRVENMPVNAGFGPKSWAWLSTQYVFYRQGIGTHANSELRYDLNRKFKEFSTDYGIDTTAGTGASAIFEIWGDNKQLFVSSQMGRFDMPKHIRVSVDGIKTLTLITKDAGDSNRDDHTNWLNPKLYR
jgi:hypothetical protein